MHIGLPIHQLNLNSRNVKPSSIFNCICLKEDGRQVTVHLKIAILSRNHHAERSIRLPVHVTNSERNPLQMKRSDIIIEPFNFVLASLCKEESGKGESGRSPKIAIVNCISVFLITLDWVQSATGIQNFNTLT